jgi:hypothetical protein
MSEEQTPLFTRLVPILYVDDIQAERDFYLSLGFTLTYAGTEFPDFIALGYGAIEFGLSRRKDFAIDLPARVLTWQFGVANIDLTKERLAAAGVTYREELVAPRPDWHYRTLETNTPNGYNLVLEGPTE